MGKSAVAQWIAERTGAAILSADSMLVYRGMDIGTAKPTQAERGDVPYFGIDCVDPGHPFSTGDWLSFVRRQLAAPEGGKRERGTGNGEAGISPISYLKSCGASAPQLVVAGGTGLYVKALLHGLDASPSDSAARARFTALFESGGLSALRAAIDANPAARALLPDSDLANPRRLIRALERAEAGDTPAAGAADVGAASAAEDYNSFAAQAAQPRRESGATSPAPAGPTSRVSAQPRAASPRPTSRGIAAPNLAAQAAQLRPHRGPNFAAAAPAAAGLIMPRAMLAARIERRIEKMFTDGLVEEAVAVRNASGGLSSTACGAIGYAEALAVADGKMTRAEAAERIAARTRQLAKRQLTWFRHQLSVEWVEVDESDTPATLGPKVMEIWKRNGYFEI